MVVGQVEFRIPVDRLAVVLIEILTPMLTDKE